MSERPHIYTGNPADLSLPMLEGRCDYGTWLRWCEEAQDWQYLVVKAGGMARKSALDSWLVERHGLEIADAHTIANSIEGMALAWNGSPVRWILSRSEPTYEQYGLTPDVVLRRWPV